MKLKNTIATLAMLLTSCGAVHTPVQEPQEPKSIIAHHGVDVMLSDGWKNNKLDGLDPDLTSTIDISEQNDEYGLQLIIAHKLSADFMLNDETFENGTALRVLKAEYEKMPDATIIDAWNQEINGKPTVMFTVLLKSEDIMMVSMHAQNYGTYYLALCAGPGNSDDIQKHLKARTECMWAIKSITFF